MSGTATERLDATFNALADPTRRGVIDLLRCRPRRAGELATAFDLVPPAMSRHLRVLRRSGLVEETADQDDARIRLYRLRSAPFAELRGWLDEIESFWTDQLAAFKEHVETEGQPRPSRPRRARRGSGR